MQSGGESERFGLILYVLGRLASKRSYQGKLVVQKILYFLKEGYGIDIPYSHSFYHYGPYSEALDKDLRTMQMFNLIRVDRDASHMGFVISPTAPTAETKEFSKKADSLISKDRDKINDAIDQLGNRPPSELELLATIHYVYKNTDSEGRSKKLLIQAVRNLKPKFDESEIEDGYNDLIGLELLEKGWS